MQMFTLLRLSPCSLSSSYSSFSHSRSNASSNPSTASGAEHAAQAARSSPPQQPPHCNPRPTSHCQRRCSTPSLEYLWRQQQLLVGQGIPTIPKSLLQKIRRWEYVDLQSYSPGWVATLPTRLHGFRCCLAVHETRSVR